MNESDKEDEMRKLSEHMVNPANEKLSIEVHDEPGDGGANHHYAVYGFHTATNKSANGAGSTLGDETALHLIFQNGPIPEAGVNGITQEVLLAIVADRLRGFQSGKFACEENACALIHIREAMHWLQQRTLERMRRGIEGTHTV